MRKPEHMVSPVCNTAKSFEEFLGQEYELGHRLNGPTSNSIR